MSIRLKLTIMFLAIATLPLLLVSALTFTNYKKSLEANRFSQLQDLAIFRADRIEAYFGGLKAHIEIAQGFYNIKKNLPILTRLADEPGNPEFLDAKKMLDAQLQQMQSVSDLSDIMLLNPQGRVVYANRPGHFFKDMPNGLDAEQKAFTEGKSRIYYSEVYFDKVEDNRFEMLLSAPAYDFNGAFIGVIAFEVDMTPLYNLLENTTGLGETGEVLLARKMGNQAEYLNPLRHDPNAALKRRVTLGEESGRPMQEAVQGRTGFGQSIDYRGRNVIAAWRYIPSLDWGLVAKIDTMEAFADVTNLRNLAAVLLVIVIVLSSITAFSIAHSISEPIKQLSEGAAIVGSGNLDYKIGTIHKDEIGQLSRTFDKMTQDLKHTLASRDELNREIEERKKVEEELRNTLVEKQFLASVVERSSQAFGVGYPDGRLGLVNPAFEALTGYLAAELRLLDWNQTLTPPEWRKLEEEKLTELNRTGQPVRYEKEYLRKDGTRVPIELLVNLSRDEAGRPQYYFAFITDITERKQSEQEIRRNMDELTRFNSLMSGRELRMIELKKEINDLCDRLGQQKRYSLDFAKEQP